MSRKYAPPFPSLALVENTWGGGLYAGCDDFSRDYALPFEHEVIAGGGHKRGASLSVRRRDAHDTSRRLKSFIIEERGSGWLPRSSWRVHVDVGGLCSL